MTRSWWLTTYPARSVPAKPAKDAAFAKRRRKWRWSPRQGFGAVGFSDAAERAWAGTRSSSSAVRPMLVVNHHGHRHRDRDPECLRRAHGDQLQRRHPEEGAEQPAP